MHDPRSNVAGAAWPALLDPTGANLLGLQWQFERTERLSAQAFLDRQFQQVEALVAHCAARSPFWRDRLRQAGISLTGAIDREAWRRLPVLTRAEAQGAGTTLHALPTPEQHGKLVRTVTSGSTGTPLTCLKTELAQLFWHGAALREALWRGWDFGGRLAVIREDPRRVAPPPHGLDLPDWGPPLSRIFGAGPAARLDMQSPVDAQARWLRRFDPDILLTWPSNLAALARHCRDNGIRPERLRVVRTLAETVTPALRALCREAWGAELVDSYSAEEIGYIALQCPSGDHYHVQGEDVLLEVLDETDAPCRPGQTGRVLVTPLHNFAMPLLRYEIGDDAEMGGACGCGRTLPTLARIVGRTRDRLILPDGERRFAYNPSEVFAGIPAIRRYQIAQVEADALEIRLIAREILTAAEEDAINQALATVLGYRFTTRFAYIKEFPRKPGGKFRDVVCEIAP